MNPRDPSTYEHWIEEACVQGGGLSWNHSRPRETLRRLIEWEIVMAMDPAISDAARTLIRDHGGTCDE